MNQRNYRQPSWTVRQLIAALSLHDPHAMVITEGCDCLGHVRCAKVVTEDDFRHVGGLQGDDDPVGAVVLLRHPLNEQEYL